MYSFTRHHADMKECIFVQRMLLIQSSIRRGDSDDKSQMRVHMIRENALNMLTVQAKHHRANRGAKTPVRMINTHGFPLTSALTMQQRPCAHVWCTLNTSYKQLVALSSVVVRPVIGSSLFFRLSCTAIPLFGGGTIGEGTFVCRVHVSVNPPS